MAESDLVERMAGLSVFQDLSPAELHDVADAMNEDHFGSGQRILQENEQGMGYFFVMLDGSAKVFQHGNHIATLKPGSFFGEITALNGGPRTASVVTEEPTWTLRLTDEDFRPFLERFPKVTFRILEELARRYQGVAVGVTAES